MWNITILGIDFFRVFYCFFIYCFVGWIWETSYCSVKGKMLINRGFLNGPIIPIYGCAATAIFMAFFNPLMEGLAAEQSVKSYVVILFLGGFVASAFEYITSWAMEKMFHAKWWDYSDVPLNIKGRIALPIAAFWGFLSIILVKVLHPFVLGIIDSFNREAGQIVGYIIFAVFMLDFVSTVIATVQLDKKLTAIAKMRGSLQDFADYMREQEVNSKTEFKEKFGETAVGDVIEHGFDRIDATIAFTLQGYNLKKEEIRKEFDDGFAKAGQFFDDNKEKLDAVLGDAKGSFDKLQDQLKNSSEAAKKYLTGYRKFTARRLALAFPTMKFKGDRKLVMDKVNHDKLEIFLKKKKTESEE